MNFHLHYWNAFENITVPLGLSATLNNNSVSSTTWKVSIIGHFSRSACVYRSSHQRCSIKKTVSKNFAIFRGKHLCWSLFSIKSNFIKKRLQHSCFHVSIAKFLKTVFYRAPPVAAPVYRINPLSLSSTIIRSGSNAPFRCFFLSLTSSWFFLLLPASSYMNQTHTHKSWYLDLQKAPDMVLPRYLSFHIFSTNRSIFPGKPQNQICMKDAFEQNGGSNELRSWLHLWSNVE